MKSTSEINKELEKLVTKTSPDNAEKYTAAALAAQALAWVLGDGLSPSVMLDNEFPE